MGLLARWRRARRLRRYAIDSAHWTDALAAEPCLARLGPTARERLRECATLIAADKVFLGAAGFQPHAAHVARIAAVAALPVMEIDPEWWYAGWHTVVIYPGGFLARHRVADQAGVVHDLSENLTGEAWEQGPVVLSWEDIDTGARSEGHNIILHEFAHKLDMRNGVANGCPPLPSEMSLTDWQHAFEAAFRDLEWRVASGLPTAVDAYARSAPAECFAVMSEMFFERPDTLAREYREVYRQLSRFYRQDPRSHVAR